MQLQLMCVVATPTGCGIRPVPITGTIRKSRSEDSEVKTEQRKQCHGCVCLSQGELLCSTCYHSHRRSSKRLTLEIEQPSEVVRELRYSFQGMASRRQFRVARLPPEREQSGLRDQKGRVWYTAPIRLVLTPTATGVSDKQVRTTQFTSPWDDCSVSSKSAASFIAIRMT